MRSWSAVVLQLCVHVLMIGFMSSHSNLAIHFVVGVVSFILPGATQMTASVLNKWWDYRAIMVTILGQ